MLTNDESNLLWYVIKGNYSEVKNLLEKGTNPNIEGKVSGSPLYAATNSKESNKKVINILLDYGANPLFFYKDKTPLERYTRELSIYTNDSIDVDTFKRLASKEVLNELNKRKHYTYLVGSLLQSLNKNTSTKSIIEMLDYLKNNNFNWCKFKTNAKNFNILHYMIRQHIDNKQVIKYILNTCSSSLLIEKNDDGLTPLDLDNEKNIIKSVLLDLYLGNLSKLLYINK
jgi:hypothetical protein